MENITRSDFKRAFRMSRTFKSADAAFECKMAYDVMKNASETYLLRGRGDKRSLELRLIQHKEYKMIFGVK